MIRCAVNNAEKIQIISLRAKSFVHLNNPYVLNGSYVNDTSHLIRYSVSDLATSIHDQGIYKCNLVNPPSLDPYAFIYPAKILFTHKWLIWITLKSSGVQ